MWRMLLPSGKLIGLLFYLLLFLLSFLFLKPNVGTIQKLSRNELARPVMGTIFLVNKQSFGAPTPAQSHSIYLAKT